MLGSTKWLSLLSTSGVTDRQTSGPTNGSQGCFSMSAVGCLEMGFHQVCPFLTMLYKIYYMYVYIYMYIYFLLELQCVFGNFTAVENPLHLSRGPISALILWWVQDTSSAVILPVASCRSFSDSNVMDKAVSDDLESPWVCSCHWLPLSGVCLRLNLGTTSCHGATT